MSHHRLLDTTHPLPWATICVRSDGRIFIERNGLNPAQEGFCFTLAMGITALQAIYDGLTPGLTKAPVLWLAARLTEIHPEHLSIAQASELVRTLCIKPPVTYIFRHGIIRSPGPVLHIPATTPDEAWRTVKDLGLAVSAWSLTNPDAGDK